MAVSYEAMSRMSVAQTSEWLTQILGSPSLAQRVQIRGKDLVQADLFNCVSSFGEQGGVVVFQALEAVRATQPQAAPIQFPLPPLLAACAENDFVKVKQALQEAQARYGDSAVNSVVSQDRQTALHTVAQTGNVELARYLLSIGADVNQRDEFRRSPLHFAAAFGHHALVRLFCEKGANVNLKDNNYDSPCSVAAHRVCLPSL
eukprot:TRINITY_DN635_c0_g1_i4.p1 TRINITY_DN635_c0_g1~~TRINITY_DN635_c0_g1_i4.p1  ORF type:complete len:215 (+),score=57.03 TRINITY_DN635_c0_g1_i4:38-646(+)